MPDVGKAASSQTTRSEMVVSGTLANPTLALEGTVVTLDPFMSYTMNSEARALHKSIIEGIFAADLEDDRFAPVDDELDGAVSSPTELGNLYRLERWLNVNGQPNFRVPSSHEELRAVSSLTPVARTAGEYRFFKEIEWARQLHFGGEGSQVFDFYVDTERLKQRESAPSESIDLAVYLDEHPLTFKEESFLRRLLLWSPDPMAENGGEARLRTCERSLEVCAFGKVAGSRQRHASAVGAGVLVQKWLLGRVAKTWLPPETRRCVTQAFTRIYRDVRELPRSRRTRVSLMRKGCSKLTLSELTYASRMSSAQGILATVISIARAIDTAGVREEEWMGCLEGAYSVTRMAQRFVRVYKPKDQTFDFLISGDFVILRSKGDHFTIQTELVKRNSWLFGSLADVPAARLANKLRPDLITRWLDQVLYGVVYDRLGDGAGLFVGPISDGTRGDFPGESVLASIGAKSHYVEGMPGDTEEERAEAFERAVKECLEAHLSVIKPLTKAERTAFATTLSPVSKLLIYSIPQLQFCASETGVAMQTQRRHRSRNLMAMSLAKPSMLFQRQAVADGLKGLDISLNASEYVEMMQFVELQLTPAYASPTLNELAARGFEFEDSVRAVGLCALSSFVAAAEDAGEESD